MTGQQRNKPDSNRQQYGVRGGISLLIGAP